MSTYEAAPCDGCPSATGWELIELAGQYKAPDDWFYDHSSPFAPYSVAAVRTADNNFWLGSDPANEQYGAYAELCGLEQLRILRQWQVRLEAKQHLKPDEIRELLDIAKKHEQQRQEFARLPIADQKASTARAYTFLDGLLSLRLKGSRPGPAQPSNPMDLPNYRRVSPAPAGLHFLDQGPNIVAKLAVELCAGPRRRAFSHIARCGIAGHQTL